MNRVVQDNNIIGSTVRNLGNYVNTCIIFMSPDSEKCYNNMRINLDLYSCSRKHCNQLLIHWVAYKINTRVSKEIHMQVSMMRSSCVNYECTLYMTHMQKSA